MITTTLSSLDQRPALPDPNNLEFLFAVLCVHIESLANSIPMQIVDQAVKAAEVAGIAAERTIEQREREIQQRLVDAANDSSETILTSCVRVNFIE